MSDNTVCVLVTATGGDLGQAVTKALRAKPDTFQLTGCDCDEGGVGSVFVDRFETLPPASDRNVYIAELNELCCKWDVDVVVPASEPEISVLCEFNDLILPCGAKLICLEQSQFKPMSDKLTCMNMLAGAIDLAPFADGSDAAAVSNIVQSVGFPLIVKSRTGSGSLSVHKANDQNELAFYVKKGKRPIIQQYIDDSGGEFSIGVFRGQSFSTAIIFRRKVGPGGGFVVCRGGARRRS